jgi:hypothetical protein
MQDAWRIIVQLHQHLWQQAQHGAAGAGGGGGLGTACAAQQARQVGRWDARLREHALLQVGQEQMGGRNRQILLPLCRLLCLLQHKLGCLQLSPRLLLLCLLCLLRLLRRSSGHLLQSSGSCGQVCGCSRWVQPLQSRRQAGQQVEGGGTLGTCAPV